MRPIVISATVSVEVPPRPFLAEPYAGAYRKSCVEYCFVVAEEYVSVHAGFKGENAQL